MSWWSSFSRLWTTPSAPQGDDEVEAVRRAMREEQRALSLDLEQLFRLYDEKVQHLSKRLQSMSAAEVESEAASIRETQETLKRLLRRAEAATKTSTQLERELAGWESRGSDDDFHADHPSVRAEVIRSELASRNPGVVRVPVRRVEPSTPVQDLRVEDENEEVRGLPNIVDVPTSADVELLPEPDSANLLAAIRDATRETERWHAIPVQDHDEETLLQVHHLRDLHAILKRLDRAKGVRRNRLEYAVNTRKIH